MSGEQIIKREYGGLAEVREQVNALQRLMQSVLQENVHYGIIPGTGKKPTLLLPGAEKICQMFGWIPSYSVDQHDLPNGHREYRVRCDLRRYVDDGSLRIVGSGDGICTTMESKYRYRYEWHGKEKSRRENPDIADCYNVVLKMAEKRALIGAVKGTAAASDIFTQDVEDMPEWMFDKPRKPELSEARKQALRDRAQAYAELNGIPVDEAKKAIVSGRDVASMDEMQFAGFLQTLDITMSRIASAKQDGYAEEQPEYEVQ